LILLFLGVALGILICYALQT